jgi:hypothetical protein
MKKILEFETPDELIEYIKLQIKQTFKFSKEYEYIVTTNVFLDGNSVTLYWKGDVSYIHSIEEMILLYQNGTIKLIEEKTKITYLPFKTIKKRKLTKREYKYLENTKDSKFDLFNEIMSTIELERKFNEYLEGREKEKDKL